MISPNFEQKSLEIMRGEDLKKNLNFESFSKTPKLPKTEIDSPASGR